MDSSIHTHSRSNTYSHTWAYTYTCAYAYPNADADSGTRRGHPVKQMGPHWPSPWSLGGRRRGVLLPEKEN